MSLRDLAEQLLEASLNVHYAHVNVTGPGFVGLHALYSDIYQYLDDAFDRVAERVRALGETMPAADFVVAEDGGNQTALVVDQLEVCCKVLASVRKNLEDSVTEAMLDEIEERLGKFIWQVKASK